MNAEAKKVFPWFRLLGLNIAVMAVIILLQGFYYTYTPSISYYYSQPFKDNFNKKAACFEVAMKINKTLIVQLIVGGLILILSNYFLVRRKSQRPLRVTVIAMLVYILLTGMNLAWLTNNYFERNM